MPEKLDTSMHVGLRTSRTDSDAKTYGFVVGWIPWDSGFRGSGLAPGDVITAVDDKVFTPEKKDFEFGQYSEEQYWDKKGAKDGTPTTLTVVRDGKTLKIAGKVRADRFYSDEDGKRTIGLDGPQEMARDGFDGPWSFWRSAEARIAPAARSTSRRHFRRARLGGPRAKTLTQTRGKPRPSGGEG
jgi:hypothetical protein